MTMPATARTDSFLAHVERMSDQILYREELLAKLQSGRPLRVKFGVDLTAATLHIGHAVNLWLLRDLQALGHKIILVMGDFTTQIGDPDGRMSARPLQDREQIARNGAAILDQIRQILRFDDPELIEVRHNAEWYDAMPLSRFMGLLRDVTHARLIARETFQKRISAKRDIFAHELLYPVLQGYDSLHLEADLTIVGADQRYNEMVGRFLQEQAGQSPQAIICTRISPGTDGELKQSKSLGNYIGLGHSARDQFMRLMNIADDLIEMYFRLYTDVPLEEILRLIEELGRVPKRLKLKLAYAIVGRYHGHAAAKAEQDRYEKMLARQAQLADMPIVMFYQARQSLVDLVRAARPGLTVDEARKLILAGDVEINDEAFKNPDEPVIIATDDVLIVGKREFSRLMVLKLHEFMSERLLMRPMQAEDIDAVRKTLPSWEIAKYLGLPKGAESEKMAREVLLRTIAEPEPKRQLIWTVALRDQPADVIGVAHMHKDNGQATENIWLNEGYHSGGYAEEVLEAVNEYAFTRAGVESVQFKGAFSHAANPQELAAMRRRFNANPSTIMPGQKPPQPQRGSVAGTWGFSKETFQRTRRNVNVISEEQGDKMGVTRPLEQGNPELQSVATKQRRERARRAKSGFLTPDAAAAEDARIQKLREKKLQDEAAMRANKSRTDPPKGPKPGSAT